MGGDRTAGHDRPDRLVLIAGTATAVGKTWVTARLATALAARSHRVWARKPAQSYDPKESPQGTDAALLGRATGEEPELVCPPERWYPLAMAPPMAAAALGRPGFSVADLVGALRWPSADALGRPPSVGLVESAGGVRSPLADDGDTVALAGLLAPDLVVVVGDAGLGTINAVRLAVDALTGTPGVGDVVVVLNRFDPTDPLHAANREWLVRRDGLSVLVTPGQEQALAAMVAASR